MLGWRGQGGECNSVVDLSLKYDAKIAPRDAPEMAWIEGWLQLQP
jgi:hypothetical protein